MLAGHEALLHIPDLQVVQGKHVFLFFLLLYRGERGDVNRTSHQWQHTIRASYHLITLDYITLILSNTTFTPAPEEYKDI